MNNNKKNLLILAHYYVPDTASTGQLLKELAESLNDEFKVTVICVVPSYSGVVDKQYKSDKYYFEELNGVNIIRVLVPEFNKRNKISRIRNISTYFFRALHISKKIEKQEYVFSISQPPILGGLLGVLVKKYHKAKYIYCIQDFNPEQIMAVKYSKNKMITNMMMVFDKNSCRKSDLVITVGRDLVETLKIRFNYKNVPKYAMINNWIDEKSVFPLDQSESRVLEFRRKYGLENKFVFMYSGNLGLYYDLENIIKVIRNYGSDTVTHDGRNVAFAFVGDGAIASLLKEYKEENGMENVVFIPYQEKEYLVYSLNAADVHWCVNAKGIKGISCPSKAYGIMGVGKPMIGVLEKESEIRMLIDEIGCGLCCEPQDYEGIAKIIDWYINNTDKVDIMGINGRDYLEKHLTRKISIDKYINAIKDI